MNTNSTQSTTPTSFQNRKEKKKKKGRKKKKLRKNKKFNLNSSTPPTSENIQPKTNFFMPNSLDTNPDNYPINQDVSNVRYESSIKSPQIRHDLIITSKPSYGDWDNNELDNEIRPRYNYYESIPLISTKNDVLDKIKKHRNYDNFMKSYTSRNFTNGKFKKY